MRATLYRVGDIADQIRGVTYRKQDASTTERDGYLPVLRAGNITDCGLTYDGLVYVPSSKMSPKQMVRKNDIVIAASSGSIEVVGKAACALEDFEGGFGAFCKVLRPHKQVDAAYFSHFFKTPDYRRRVSFLATGANINNLRNEDLDGLQIPLPPLAEQKRIAGILDAADDLRAKRREALAQLDTLLQSTFLDMFGDPVTNPMGWGRRTFGAITSIEAPLVDPREAEYRQLLHYGPDRIEKNTGELLPAQTAEEDELISGKFLCSPGEILYSKIRPYLNKVALVQQTCLCSADVYPVRPDRNVLTKEYLVTLLRSTAFLDYVAGFSRRANIPKLNRKQFAGYNAPVPPLSLQRRFAAIVESVERQKARMRSHLVELDALFASLQDRAFKGEL